MLLGLDIGTTHTKAAVYNIDGEKLAHAKALTPKCPNSNNYDPHALWETVAALIKQVSHQQHITALALTGMGEAGVFLNDADEPIEPIIPWNDTRAHAYCEALTNTLGAQRVYELTGLMPNAIHSVFKWAHLKDTQPDTWKNAHVWLSSVGYIRHHLTGVKNMEATQAVRTMAYDLSKGTWSTEILNALELPADFLPELVSALDVVGGVTARAAQLTGLPVGTPVVAGGHDHVCAAFACGTLTPEIVLDSLGTAEGLTFGLPRAPDPAWAGGFAIGPHVIPGHSYLMGGVYSSGGTLMWLKTLLGIDAFSELVALATSVSPADCPVFIPHFYGAAPPFNEANATASFTNVKPSHSRAEFARAVYEGIAFEIRAGIEAFETLIDVPVQSVRFVGGASNDTTVNRIRASILNKPIALAQHDDMVTLGGALLAGVATGVYATPADAVTRTFSTRVVIEPDAAWQPLYEARYQVYQQALRAQQVFRAAVKDIHDVTRA